MATEPSLLPLAAVLLPVVTALLITAARRFRRLVEFLLVAGALATFAVVAQLFGAVQSGRELTTELGELIPGFPIGFRADGMGMVFAVLAAALWVLASIYTAGYLRGSGATNRTRFSAFYALSLGSAFGVAFAADFLTFFIAYELLTIATYPLVTHAGNPTAIGAGRRYLAYLLPSGVALLLAVVLLAALVGDLTFRPGGFVGDGLGTATLLAVFLLCLVGVGTKAGLMPLHRWLAAGMVAPTPVSALLHAVAVVKAGVFGIGRVTGFVFGPDVLEAFWGTDILTVLAGATVVLASVAALRQDHLKRRLAYSTIAHLALILLGFAVLTPAGFDGGLIHIINHGVLKITLFFCAGALYVVAHKEHVSELDGIGHQMPVTMAAFGVASLGLAGLPPMGGFVSKWQLVHGALQGQRYVVATVVVLSGLLTAAYLFPIVVRAFFRPGPAGARSDGGPSLAVPLAVTAGTGLVLGISNFGGIFSLTETVARAVTGGAP
jgi:multicomponent Na+:H+ antiporter subunit D